jgi:transposase
MMQTMTRGNESSAATRYLLVSFELSQRWWRVGFTTGMGHRVRTRRIAAGALESVAEAIADAKKMFGLAADARVISCYEAGREGFWLHRYLTGRGATNYVVDSASIEVDRRALRNGISDIVADVRLREIRKCRIRLGEGSAN